MVGLNFDTFNEPAKAHVRDDTPSVLSLGKRCMEQGYSFIWPSGRGPYMINSDGDKIKMEVRDLIPYVYLGDEDYSPKPSQEAGMVAKDLGLIRNKINRTLYIDGISGGEMSESSDEAFTSFGVGGGSMRKMMKEKKKKKKRSKKRKHSAVPGEGVEVGR